MKSKIWLGLFVAAWMFAPQAAYATMIQGTIAELNSGENAITLERTDPMTQFSEKLNISILPGATFKGFESLEELQVGDEVRVEASENAETGAWEAYAVEPSEALEGEEIAAEEPAAEEPAASVPEESEGAMGGGSEPALVQ